MIKNMDKYKQFLNLLYKEGDYPHENYVKVLHSLTTIPQAYLFFYENLPEQVKHYIIENKKYYAEEFFYVLASLDNTTFNQYFFKNNFLDFDKIVPIERLRLVATEHLDNEKLQDFIKELDKPKSLDKLIETLALLYSKDKTRYQEIKEQYKKEILKINKINNEKSRTIVYLERWMSNIASSEGFANALSILDDLGINFELVFNENKKKIRIYPLKKEDFKGFDILFKRNSGKNRYDLLNKYIRGDFINPLSMLDKIEEVVPERYVQYWEIFEEYLKFQKEDNNLFQMLLNNKETQWEKKITEGADLFIAYFSDKKFRDRHCIYLVNFRNSEEQVKDIMKDIEVKLLHYKLNNDVENKVQKPKLKI